jgi:hypothetical protein
MDWVKFLIGLAILVSTYFWRRLSIWAYGKDGEEPDYYSLLKKKRDWFGIILFIIVGIIAIIFSFVPPNK